MEKHGIDHLAVFTEDAHLSEYTGECDGYRKKLSGFTGSAGIYLVSESGTLLWTDSRYYIQAAKELEKSGTVLMKQGMAGVLSFEEYLREHVWDGQVIAFDLKTLSYDRYMKIREKLPESVQIVDGAAVLREVCDDMPKRVFNTVQMMPESFSGKSTEKKLADVRNNIKRSYVRDGSYTYIVSDLASIMWLFNLRGSDIAYVPVAYSYAKITEYTAVLYINRKSLTDEAAHMLEDAGVTVKEYSLFYRELEDTATDVVLADRYKNNSLIPLKFDSAGIYKECLDQKIIKKAVKNQTEIKGMTDCHLKDAVIMCRFIKRIKDLAASDELPDEYEIGEILDGMRLEGGCESPAFSTICAYGPNSAVVHYRADKGSALKPEPKGFLLVDSGGQYSMEGTTDITRTISLGELNELEKKVYTTVLKGNLRLMDMIFPEGFKGVLLDQAAEAPLWEEGFFCGHGIGHGVGHFLSVHESETRISRSSSQCESEFHPGVTVSDEPGVYLEGQFGVRLENILLTQPAESIDSNRMCRFVPLTLVPFDREAIDHSLLDDKEERILAAYNELIMDKVFPLLDEEHKAWLKENIDIK